MNNQIVQNTTKYYHLKSLEIEQNLLPKRISKFNKRPKRAKMEVLTSFPDLCWS